VVGTATAAWRTVGDVARATVEVVGATVVDVDVDEVVVVGASVVDVDVEVVVGCDESALAKWTAPAVVDRTTRAAAAANSSARVREEGMVTESYRQRSQRREIRSAQAARMASWPTTPPS
jgi:hypothetical protein